MPLVSMSMANPGLPYAPGTITFDPPPVQNGGFSPPITADYLFTVPSRVFSITLSAQGGPGTGDCTSCQGYYIWGGSGAYVLNKVVPVNPGEIISIYVGGFGAIMSYRTVQCGGYPGSLFTPPYAGTPTTIIGSFGTFVFGGGYPDGGPGGTTTVPGGVNGVVQGAANWPASQSYAKFVW